MNIAPHTLCHCEGDHIGWSVSLKIVAVYRPYLSIINNENADFVIFPVQFVQKSLQTPAELLGDIIISAETAARDALAGGLHLMDEMEFLLIHGLLHLLGYDHENTDQEDAERMKRKERELFYLLRHYHLD